MKQIYQKLINDEKGKVKHFENMYVRLNLKE